MKLKKKNIRAIYLSDLQKRNTASGITLIALIITIIILLILAMVSINLIINGGFIKKTKLATQEYKIAEEKEKIGIGYQDYKIAEIQGETPTLTVSGATVTEETKGWKIVFDDTGNSYLLKKDGTIAKTNVEPTDIYVTLYKDGTLAFSNNEETIKGKEIEKSYGKIEESNFKFNNPWSNENSKIITVDFVNEIVPTNTAYWFLYCYNLTTVNNIQNLNTINVTSMDEMFYQCNNLKELDISTLDTSNVQIMSLMFYECNNLTKLNMNNLDTSNVTNMSGMFNNCNSLEKLNISGFNTSKVNYMNTIFSGCRSLTELDLSNFDTSNVTYMSGMFSGCSSLTELKLSSFNTNNVTDMSSMFNGCSNLTKLDLSNFNTSKVEDMSDMFSKCSNLKLVYGRKDRWITDNVTDSSNMFSNCGTNRITYKTYQEGNKLIGYDIEAGQYWINRDGVMKREPSGWKSSTTSFVTLDPEKTYHIKMSPETPYYYAILEVDLDNNTPNVNAKWIPGNQVTTITGKEYIVINVHYNNTGSKQITDEMLNEIKETFVIEVAE